MPMAAGFHLIEQDVLREIVLAISNIVWSMKTYWKSLSAKESKSDFVKSSGDHFTNMD